MGKVNLSCRNCKNLKPATVTREDLEGRAVHKEVFEEKFSRGGEIFAWLIKNGYLDKVSERKGRRKRISDEMAEVLNRQYPDNFQLIWDILEQSQRISKSRLEKLMRERNGKAVYLSDLSPASPKIPLSWGVFRKARRHGRCEVRYCKHDLLRRHVYESKPNFLESSIIKMRKKCPKFL